MTTIPPPHNKLPVWVLFLLATVGPGAAALTFSEQITQHPWPALGIGILYEVVLLVIGFVGKVWGKLESRWVDRAAEWVDSRVG